MNRHRLHVYDTPERLRPKLWWLESEDEYDIAVEKLRYTWHLLEHYPREIEKKEKINGVWVLWSGYHVTEIDGQSVVTL